MRDSKTNAENNSVCALERRDALIRWSRRLALAAVVAAIAFGGQRGYAVWRKNHLAQQTSAFVRQNDYASAVLVARRLLELDPNNPIACRALAEMAEKAGQPAAVSWRQRLAQSEPTLPNQLALAKSAIRFGQVDLADVVLQAVPEASRQRADYQQIAGAQALTRQDPAAAQALALAPNDPSIELSLAILRLPSPDPQVAAAARATLERLVSEAKVRPEALRALTALTLAQGNRESAKKWASELMSNPEANFSDALLNFQAVQDPSALADLQG